MSAALPSPSPFSSPSPAGPLLVACLCAQWCRTCDAYRDTLVALRDTMRLGHPEAPMRFVWIDIEDESDLIGDLDIEDFPTILLARDDRVLFFGPVMPHAQTLDRLVRNAITEHEMPSAAHAQSPDVLALPARLAAHPSI
ncbi:MAG: thioredoxin family protein [Betaproteobacteria bacterium]